VIDDYFDDEMTVALFEESDEHGKATYGTAQSTTGRFQFKSILFTNQNGHSEHADGVAYLPLSVPCALKSKVTFEGQAYSVEMRSTHRLPGESEGHQRLALQRIA